MSASWSWIRLGLTIAFSAQKFNDARVLSYCPADGRLLGDERGIRPATPADVDSAIKRAAAAQETWQNTSFAERRRVLRTLLKYGFPESIIEATNADEFRVDMYLSTKTTSLPHAASIPERQRSTLVSGKSWLPQRSSNGR
jgi:hypothetical protein